MLCNVKNGAWQIGASSIRAEDQLATGFRFVNWVHDASDPEVRAVPTPAATNAVYRQLEQWLPMTDRETDNVLALTTRTYSAQHLQGFFQQSGRRANAETAVKVAGATAKHCVVLHGKSTFLSGTSLNVAYSRATDLTISACPVNMQGTTGMSQVLSALLHGVCTVYTNDQQTSKAFVQGEFPIKWKWVSESTADFLAAMEPQPLWNGSLPVCLVEYHQGLSRRLRLVLTWQSYLTKGEKELLDHQHPVHGRIHSSGLLFGYAADRCTEPDWYVLPDGHLADAWKLIHAARKGGDCFCVGREARYAFRQADDAANRAKDYSFESLRKIYFYDAWRWTIELNQPNSLLRLPPRPGLLQNGCYWQRLPSRNDDAAQPHDPPARTIQAEVSLTETSSAEGEEDASSSEVPEPAGTDHAAESPTSPILIGSAEEEQAGSRQNVTEPSANESPAETIVSASEEAASNEGRRSESQTSPVTQETDRTQEQRLPIEGEQAEETESSTTDEVINLDDSTEAIPEQTASSSQDTKVLTPASTAQPSARCLPTAWDAATDQRRVGTKRPAPSPPLDEAEDHRKPLESTRTAANAAHEVESGHPCGCPLVPLSENGPGSPPIEEARRRSQGASSPPAASAVPPLSKDKTKQSAVSPDSPTSPACSASKGVDKAPAPQATARPRIQGPFAVKSKLTKPAEYPQGRGAEQGMIDAIQSRLHTPPPPEAGLLSIAAARSAATAATNPQMPAADTNDPKGHTSTKEEAPAIEIFLAEADDQSGPVDADIAHLAEQRAMHSLLRYQTQAVKHSTHTSTNSVDAATMLPPVAPPVSLYANLPQEWPLARLSVQVRHIGVLLRVTLYRRVAELNFRGVDFRSLPREVMRNIVHDFNNIGGDLARRLASLFAFLKPDPSWHASGHTGACTLCRPGLLAIWTLILLRQGLRVQH